ncbi:ABC transporter permease [Shewanella amazonensis]|uniref:Binding-protein-dependent transport systems inner membrane component n=1 Tax=Shewanella amazonensis (strain ATCC BAA-1098 / SB2B) TaxID=326297 RepID=A1S5U6_SHEAM|nr:ABC transporter permease [Shewanella amazonensis]ABL99752.1 binding-protein-dependent transport systems inner membrane component [Shewanella amazonensis SB2B]
MLNLAFIGRWQRLTLGLWLLCFCAFWLADTEVIALEPWNELGRMFAGFITPDFFATEHLIDALWQTVSFTLLGISLGLVIGVPLSLVYHQPLVAAGCAFIRAIHEIFWALLFLQLFGLSPVTGVLALALPYGTTFARVFHDILCRAPKDTADSLPGGTDPLSQWLYGKIAHVLPELLAYTRYRFECALRSSAVLGFVGMPTLGFHLESAFKQGNYSEGAALLLLFIFLIGTLPYWCKRWLLPFYMLAAVYFLPPVAGLDGSLIWRFISEDIWPHGLRQWQLGDLGLGAALVDTLGWLQGLILSQALPGIMATLVLALGALGLTHLLVCFLLPLAYKPLSGRLVSGASTLSLLLMRSIPEYILAFVFMLLLGPSMLPAMLALALHNAGLILFLTARSANRMPPRDEDKGGLDGFGYRVLPAIYPGMMALLFYRFEVILRETAILGMLGVATLGFYIDSNFSEIRFAGAMVLMGITAMVNVLVDAAARRALGQGRHKTERC